MSESSALQTNSAGETALRNLSTVQQSAWIERLFSRLTAIYGDQFARNWTQTNTLEVKVTWIQALGGFSAPDISAALNACLSLSKPPNLPEFAALCRQNMVERVKPVEHPMTAEERASSAKVAHVVAEGFKTKESGKGYMFNGVLITPFKKWAIDLVKREANREQISIVSRMAWREVLGYPENENVDSVWINAQKAMEKTA